MELVIYSTFVYEGVQALSALDIEIERHGEDHGDLRCRDLCGGCVLQVLSAELGPGLQNERREHRNRDTAYQSPCRW